MVEDIFSGLLEGLAQLILELLAEFVGEILGGVVEWLGGGGKEDVVGGVERYKFLPKGDDG